MRLLSLFLISLSALGACTANFKPDHLQARNTIVDTAMAQVGVPYYYSGANPQTGFDCSGLVLYSYLQSGIKLPRSSDELLVAGPRVPYRHAQPGDLLFYRFEDRSLSSGNLHVVLYTGGTAGVHAPGNGRGVSLVRLDQPAWTNRYVAAVNVLARIAAEPDTPQPDATGIVAPAERSSDPDVAEQGEYGASILRQ